MQTLAEFLGGAEQPQIDELAGYIGQYFAQEWQPLWQANQEELRVVYANIGEPAYGKYMHKLCEPANRQLGEAGFLARPNFPGTLRGSREWGRDNERQRWMWCVINRTQGEPVGTLVVKFYHDHTRFRLPHPPAIIALKETETNAIVKKLSEINEQFESADD